MNSTPRQTRDGGEPVRSGYGTLTCTAYGHVWANVSNTPFRE